MAHIIRNVQTSVSIFTSFKQTRCRKNSEYLFINVSTVQNSTANFINFRTYIFFAPLSTISFQFLEFARPIIIHLPIPSPSPLRHNGSGK